MTIGKIKIDLKYLKYNLDAKELEIVANYLNGNRAIETIRKLIKIISNSELTLYTEEDFNFDYIHKFSNFVPITLEDFEEFKKKKVFDADLTDVKNYYANFHYLEGKCISPKKKNSIKDSPIPCLINLDKNIMTYYIFRWRHYDNHNFEIED